MSLRIGQVIYGKRASYQVMEPLKSPTVFKAKILSGSEINQEWAVIKTAIGDLERAALRREYNTYQINAFSSNRYIRTMYEAIGPIETSNLDASSHLVFEYMDTVLRKVPSDKVRGTTLPRNISQSVLSALEVMRSQRRVHTDVNINNVLISDLNGDSPVVKLGDLGMVMQDGFDEQRLQSLPSRAPEVWQGHGCFHSSDVWSVGVMLAQWASWRYIFGARDKIIEEYPEAYCIAKLMALIGPLGDPTDQYAPNFELAEQLLSMDFGPEFGKVIKVGNLRDELRSVANPPVPTELVDFIIYLLTADPD
ncbi:kinase-like protein [Aspergillus sclerotioniger CBS 115572]|uniref:Cyclin-dependent kinase 1 n=1 Tax=Aspergillus sclerotioniger CBS 115572 TaxID=1450535 RepID=A0A317WSP3_9EURO|nr:kinase-like protein [Aspergillus sclerotioniger CBS 115572]PWY87908.1 kinase-like protein [Aspergillus sclerotioniger CBS 115572]